MTHLFFFAPAVVAMIVAAALLREFQAIWLPYPQSEAEKKSVVLLRSWLTPEQSEQWATHREFEVTGCDTGSRYRITDRAVMNVYQLDPSGRPVAELCFAPIGGLAVGDMLLAQKIALETMERQALALANRQPCLRPFVGRR